MCPFVHTNDSEKFSFNSRDSSKLMCSEEPSVDSCQMANIREIQVNRDNLISVRLILDQLKYNLVEFKKSGKLCWMLCLDHWGQNQDVSRIYGVQNNSGTHCDILHSNNEQLEKHFVENCLKTNNDGSIESTEQTKNKLVRSCPETSIDNFQQAVERTRANRVGSCPQTSVDNIHQANERKRKNLVRSCPQTSVDKFQRAAERKKQNLVRSCPSMSRWATARRSCPKLSWNNCGQHFAS